MISAEKFGPRYQSRYPQEHHIYDRRKAEDVENGRSFKAIERKVDGLIRSLELQSLPSEIARCQFSSNKDKWESLHQVGSDVNSESDWQESRMAESNIHQFLLSDCRQFLSSDIKAEQKSLDTRLGIWQEYDSPKNLPMLLARIPDLNQVNQCLEGYHQSCAWIHRLLHWPSFRTKVRQMLSRKDMISYCNQPDIHWLAVLFAACGLGLWADDSIDVENCKRTGLPQTKPGRRRLALSWLRCASSALVLGHHDQYPSVDSLRSMSLLLCFPLYFSDEPSMEGATELIMRTINLARQINMDVDPDDLPSCRRTSEMAKDERRRVMVAILCQEFQLGGLFCKKGYFEPPSQFTLKMPKQLDNEEDRATQASNFLMDSGNLSCDHAIKTYQTPELDGVISRYKVGQIWQSIGISYSGNAGPLAHRRVLDLDQQLLNIEKEFPSALKTTFEPHRCVLHPSPRSRNIADMDRLSTHIVLASAHIRLHRPFVIPREGISRGYQEWHRERILYHGRYILSVNESDHLPLLKHVSMSLFVIAACIALSALLITPTEKEDLISLRQQVQQVYSSYSKTTSNSPIWHHSYKLLGVLLETDKNIRLNPGTTINLALLESILH